MARRRNTIPPSDELRDRIESRVGYRCEYCRAPQVVCGYRFHLDHIRPLGTRRLGCSFQPMPGLCDVQPGERR